MSGPATPTTAGARAQATPARDRPHPVPSGATPSPQPATRPRAGISRAFRPSVGATARDRKILKQMHLKLAPKAGLSTRATALALDSFSGLGILTITAPPTTDLAQLERDLMFSAFHAAVNSMRADQGVNSLIIRCISTMPDEAGQPEDVIIFRAAVARKDILKWINTNGVPTLDQLRREILRGIWWDQQALARLMATAK